MPLHRSTRSVGAFLLTFLFVLSPLLVSTAVNAAADAPVAPTVDMGTYTVAAPAGGYWQVQKDFGQGLVTFRENAAGGWFTVISVLPGTWTGASPLNEDEIAESILRSEENNMTARGASRQYSLHDVVHPASTTIGGRKVHSMYYTILQKGSLPVPAEIKYAMYVYMPANFPYKKEFYGFVIGSVAKLGESTRPVDLSRVLPVIASLHVK